MHECSCTEKPTVSSHTWSQITQWARHTGYVTTACHAQAPLYAYTVCDPSWKGVWKRAKKTREFSRFSPPLQATFVILWRKQKVAPKKQAEYTLFALGVLGKNPTPQDTMAPIYWQHGGQPGIASILCEPILSGGRLLHCAVFVTHLCAMGQPRPTCTAILWSWLKQWWHRLAQLLRHLMGVIVRRNDQSRLGHAASLLEIPRPAQRQ